MKLQSGQEGHVADIGSRRARLRQLPNNMMVVPNSQIVQTIITNYPPEALALLASSS